jgi:hypothetical protein
VTLNNPNEVLLACVGENQGPLSTPTDTLGLTWTKRASVGSGHATEEWYAIGPGAVTYPQYDTITFTQGSNDYISAGVIVINGANTSSPFDGTAVTGTSDPLSITTTHADTVITGCFTMSTQSSPTAGTGYTSPFAGFFSLDEYKLVSSTQSGLSVSIGTGAGDARAGIADAIVLNAAPVLAAIPTGTTITGATSTTVTLSNNVINAGVASGDNIYFIANDPTHNTTTNPNIVTAESIGWTALIYNAMQSDAHMSGLNMVNYTGFVPSGNPCCGPFNTNVFNYNNIHFYPSDGEQPVVYTGFTSMKAAAQSGGFGGASGDGTKPWVMTEGGYCTPTAQSNAVDTTTQARLLLNLYLDMFNAGFPYTLVYTLYDGNAGDSSCFDNYGLYESNQITIKASGTMVKNLNAILNDTAGNALSFTPGQLNYTVTGLPAQNLGAGNGGGFQMLLQTANGHFFIPLWNEGQIWN